MSLVKQLLLAIAVLMTLAFGVSLVVSILSARNYLQQQLQVKNIDNATTLALSLTQLEKDPVAVELQVAAQFDAGHYRFIRINKPDGSLMLEKVFQGDIEGAPKWFAGLIPIRAEPGRAQIQDGWKQFGTLTLASHEQYVYKSLWDGTLELLAWFVGGGLAAALLGSYAIRVIIRPLNDVVAQAAAIADRRFLTIDKEPRTPELRAVTRAMNDMVTRVKAMFAEEASRLENLRRKVNRDEVTGLSSREYFMSHLRETVNGDQFGSSGSVVLVRLVDLNALNNKLGRKRADECLKQLGKVLYDSGEGRVGQRAGRVKGGEFAIVCPTFDSPTAAAQDIHERLVKSWLPNWEAEIPDLFHLAAVGYQRDQGIGDILTRADQALAQSAAKGVNTWYAAEDGSAKVTMPPDEWRSVLSQALTNAQLSLSYFPVVKAADSSLLHQEGVIRLTLGESTLSAGDFMPIAGSLNLTGPIDLGVVRLALEQLQKSAADIAVNISAETLADFGFRAQLTELLKGHPELCKRLLFEVPEYGVFRQFDAFRELARSLNALGCRVGIEYFGQRFAESDKLASLGLDYIKVHPSYVRGISTNVGNQEFLKGLVNVAHALGITVIALGVEKKDDLPLLAQLGFDGATGPGIG